MRCQIINCSWTKFIAIIVNLSFYAKFLLEGFQFSSDFYALDFLRFTWSKILSQSQFQAAELNWRQFCIFELSLSRKTNNYISSGKVIAKSSPAQQVLTL